MLEIELKFPVTRHDVVEQRLTEWAATPVAPVVQIDRYFAHPSRDFAQTDEAFRVRSVGNDNCVTYKGPVLDRQVKTRHEIEVPIASGAEAADQFRAILVALGFREVRAVEKRRTAWRFSKAGRDFELTLDDVAGLGLFVEIETLADPREKEVAQEMLLNLARELELGTPERRSYLALLLERDRAAVQS